VNAGLSNLTRLKAYVLAAALRAATDYDDQIVAIGQGVAGAFENYCNRKFARAAGTQQVISADRCQFLLSRLPLEAVTAVDLKMKESDGWAPQDLNDIIAIDLANGIINYPERADVGPWYAQVRFTYTGGYFWEQLEPADVGYPTAAPAGAATLPPDLLSAWLIQCEIVWKMRDKLGAGITQGDGKGRGPVYEINDLDLAPLVKNMLSQYVRYQLT
jgi:hypothetical protein